MATIRLGKVAWYTKREIADMRVRAGLTRRGARAEYGANVARDFRADGVDVEMFNSRACAEGRHGGAFCDCVEAE